MRVTPTIRKHFAPRLAALGFAAAPGLGTVWVKDTPGMPPLMVEVEKERWFNRFHVTLRRRGRQEELFHVAEAAGLRWYEYSNEAELAGAAERAAAHFDQWGKPWLAGESVDSPALSALRQHHAEAALGRHQHEAQVAFREGRFADVLVSLSAAEQHGELSEVSRRYRALAQKRIHAGAESQR